MSDPTAANGARRRTNGWLLHPLERLELLKIYPPRYADVIAHHVTLSSGDPASGLPKQTRGTIIGRADDGRGVEALVVAIGDTTHRPSGGTYHITWSLDRAANREPRESNDVIANFGWEPIQPRRSLELMPACWERETS